MPIHPKGTLSDYVPFYFTPFSPMAYKIHTGHGVKQVNRPDIVVLVASLRNLADAGVPFIFSDRHAVLRYAQFFDTLERLDRIDWHSLQSRDFQYDDEDPEKVDKYQAEALGRVHTDTPECAILRPRRPTREKVGESNRWNSQRANASASRRCSRNSGETSACRICNVLNAILHVADTAASGAACRRGSATGTRSTHE